MTKLATYSPEDVNVLIAGVLTVTGMAAGSFLTISKNLQPFSSQRTSDGVVGRLANKDDTYTISLTLHQGSEDNDFITKLSLLDQTLYKGKFPIFIKDLKGTSFFFATTAWVEQYPDQEFGDTIGTRTWVFRAVGAVTNVGSNVEPSGILKDLVNTVIAAAPQIGSLL